MINRNRAWRRKKNRHSLDKFRQTKEWLQEQLTRRAERQKHPTAKAELKPHKHGKLTHFQDLKVRFAMGYEMIDELST